MSVELIQVAPSSWRQACEALVADGARFCGAYAAGPAAERRWTALFADGPLIRALSMRPLAGRADSIVDLVPAAQWDEREAHDLHGLGFDGHEPLRPLLDHDAPTAAWTVPVAGADPYDVAVGPIHAGVIESGHFRFHVVGERILLVDLRLFYKHRGLERAAEGEEPAGGLPFAQRACGACAVANPVAYALACEGALGLVSPREVRRARTLLLELERLYNHLGDVAAICAGVGFAPGNMVFAALKERALRLNRELGGHRFLFGTVEVGASRLEVSAAAADHARAALRELGQETARAWREICFAASVQARLDGVGRLGREEALELGAVGPVARAAGVAEDVRGASPGLWYGSAFAAAAPPTPSGDVAARLELRGVELSSTLAILDELLAEPFAPAVAEAGAAATPLGVGRVESPRGETVCAVELRSGRLARLHLRTGSYANWPALARAAAGELLPDFPLINKSFELCYACADR